jgi:hypothetical protein
MPRGVSLVDHARLQSRLWTPARGPLSLWLDGADLSTLSVSGSSVTALRDKSGNLRHATTTVRNPGITRVNDLNVINFTASGATKLDTPDFSIAPNRQFCIFAVVSGAGLLGGSTYRRIFTAKGVNPDTLAAGATYAQGYLGSGANAGTAMQIAGGNGTTTPIVTGLGTGPQLLTGAFGTAGLAANENAVSANGGARSVLGGQSGALSTTGIRVGSDTGTAGGSAWNGWIAELIMTLALSFPQVQAIEGYLAWKWGLVENLPAAHPFKNRPPLIGD